MNKTHTNRFRRAFQRLFFWTAGLIVFFDVLLFTRRCMNCFEPQAWHGIIAAGYCLILSAVLSFMFKLLFSKSTDLSDSQVDATGITPPNGGMAEPLMGCPQQWAANPVYAWIGLFLVPVYMLYIGACNGAPPLLFCVLTVSAVIFHLMIWFGAQLPAVGQGISQFHGSLWSSLKRVSAFCAQFKVSGLKSKWTGRSTGKPSVTTATGPGSVSTINIMGDTDTVNEAPENTSEATDTVNEAPENASEATDTVNEATENTSEATDTVNEATGNTSGATDTINEALVLTGNGFDEAGNDCPEELLADDASEDDSYPPGVSQQWTRQQGPDGSDTLSGWIRASFQPHQQTEEVCVAFCPPFNQTPKVDYYQLSGEEANITISSCYPQGMRATVKLHRSAPDPVEVIFEVIVSSPKVTPN